MKRKVRGGIGRGELRRKRKGKHTHTKKNSITLNQMNYKSHSHYNVVDSLISTSVLLNPFE